MRNKTDFSAEDAVNTMAANPVPRFAENGYRLPDPLPIGLVLTDSTQRQWLLGKSIGCGGFGEIYCAKEVPESDCPTNTSLNGNKCSDINGYNGLPKRSCVQKFNRKQIQQKSREKLNKLIKESNHQFVVKVDHISGPLYAEMHFYHRVAKPKLIDNWMLTQRLAFIGMPRYVASGIYSATNTCRKYRFLVLDRLGVDLQKILNKQNNKLSLKSAYTITMMTLDILAYIHSFGYIHADIKASNLLLGRLETTSPARELYLVDYGLVERYRTQDGEHKEEEEDNRRANSGTIEFTSRDGHVGALTRRSDLEILAYNAISWLSGGRLPWIDCKEHESVRKEKEYYMSHIDELLRYAFKSKNLVPKGLEEFIRSISRLGFKEDPNYAGLKLLLTRAIVSSGYTNDGLITWGENSPKKSNKKGVKRPASSSVELGRGKVRKIVRQEFEQFELCEIPRKMGRNRPKPTPASTPATNFADIELSNPTPQMLEVMKKMRQKCESLERVIDSSDSHNCNDFIKKRIRTFSSTNKKRSKTNRKLKLSSNSSNNKKLKNTVICDSIKQLNNISNDINNSNIDNNNTNNDLKFVSNNVLTKTKKRKTNKKCSIIKRKCSTNRIPLQKLEINVKTTNTTKRCSNRTVDSNTNKKTLKTVLKQRKQQKEKKILKTSITRRKSKNSTKISKKLSKKSSIISSPKTSAQNRLKVSLVVDLPNGSFKYDKYLRNSTTNGSKKSK